MRTYVFINVNFMDSGRMKYNIGEGNDKKDCNYDMV